QQRDEMLAVVDVAEGGGLRLHLGSKHAVVVIGRTVDDGFGVRFGLAGRRDAGDEAEKELREAVEGVTPGLPESQFTIEVVLPTSDVQKLTGALGHVVLGVTEEQRSDQLRIRFVLASEGP